MQGQQGLGDGKGLKGMGWLVRRLRDERGISAVIVAICMIALMGAGMITLDYGNTIQTRRNLITGTDSTALQQAVIEAKTVGAACQLGWTDYLARNVGTFVAGTEQCVRHPDLANPGTGWLEVQARKESRTRLGGFFGIGNTEPWSLSAAQYGFVTSVRGLRPMSFCNLNEHVQEWLNIVDVEPDGSTITPAEQASYNLLRGSNADHPTPAGSTGVVHRMWENKGWTTGLCGPGASGNWGWMDFDCGTSGGDCGNPNNDLRDWLQNGFDGNVGVFSGPMSSCDTSDDPYDYPGGCVNGETGSRGAALDTELQYLVTNGIRFHVPIFKYVCCTGNTVHFQLYGFLGVRMWGFGTQASEHYFDLEFFELLTQGLCCTKTAVPGSVKGVKICDVDHDPDATAANQAPNCS